MKIGTKSLLYGVHHLIWHPLTVIWAWRRIYGRPPGFRETVCIIVHDWGYWGCPEMDGAEGSGHPYLGAAIAGALFGDRYAELCLLHSRKIARRLGCEPSCLCWADKASLAYDPPWFYLLRARLSGELAEYRSLALSHGGPPPEASHNEWYTWLRALLCAGLPPKQTKQIKRRCRCETEEHQKRLAVVQGGDSL